jgi:hypothetical protein
MMERAMTRPWPEIRRQYAEEVPRFAWTDGMLAVIDHIGDSGLGVGLHGWTSMFDLCIAQAVVTYPYRGPYLRISPVAGTDRLEFRYVDTPIQAQQWSREASARDALRRFKRFVDQLRWSTLPQRES